MAFRCIGFSDSVNSCIGFREFGFADGGRGRGMDWRLLSRRMRGAFDAPTNEGKEDEFSAFTGLALQAPSPGSEPGAELARRGGVEGEGKKKKPRPMQKEPGRGFRTLAIPGSPALGSLSSVALSSELRTCCLTIRFSVQREFATQKRQRGVTCPLGTAPKARLYWLFWPVAPLHCLTSDHHSTGGHSLYPFIFNALLSSSEGVRYF